MNILLLTTLYSLPNEKIANNTNVCGSFAKEWAKKGHKVRVIYQYPIYHQIFHIIASIFEKYIANKFYGAITTNRITKTQRYIDDSIEIIRIPIYKFAPRYLYSQQTIYKHYQSILNENIKDNYIPDIIVGHFFYPNIEIVSMLKNEYKCKGGIIVHYQGISINKVYKHLEIKSKKHIENIDIWGYRSVPIKKYFENTFGEKSNYFYCPSGVPNCFINYSYPQKDFSTIKEFIFVGALIKRKHPLKIIKAIYQSQIEDFNLNYVGKGAQINKIIKYAQKNNISNKITFHGHVKREEIIAILDKSQIFIMISEKETFGLVYLEAMARGCIVIASKNEGMEEIIINGFNGFLCEAGNEIELINIINHINNMSIKDKIRISINAYNTAINMTDKKVAENYLSNLQKTCNN